MTEFVAPQQTFRDDGDSYDGWIWNLERVYLMQVLDRSFGARRPLYLDFACGTGRVISTLEGGRMGESTGIEASPHMLAAARARLNRSQLILGDPISEPALIHGPYDLITVFRYFVGANDHVRSRTLSILHRILTDDGRLIVGVEANSTSLHGIGLVGRRFVRRSQPSATARTISFWTMRRLLHRHGFEIVEAKGFGLVSSGLLRLLGSTTSLGLERLGNTGITKYSTAHLVLVCQKRDARELP